MMNKLILIILSINSSIAVADCEDTLLLDFKQSVDKRFTYIVKENGTEVTKGASTISLITNKLVAVQLVKADTKTVESALLFGHGVVDGQSEYTYSFLSPMTNPLDTIVNGSFEETTCSVKFKRDGVAISVYFSSAEAFSIDYLDVHGNALTYRFHSEN